MSVRRSYSAECRVVPPTDTFRHENSRLRHVRTPVLDGTNLWTKDRRPQDSDRAGAAWRLDRR